MSKNKGKENNEVILDEDNDEEILAMKKQVEEKLKEKNSSKETYSAKEVDQIVKDLEKKFLKMKEGDDEDFIDLLDPEANKRKFVRLARLNNRFIVGLKDMNNDSYSDEPIYITNVENPNRKGELIPWSTFLYEDGSEELYPYLSFMNRANGIWAEVIEEKKTDVSETFGLIDVKTMDEENEWSMKSTGKKVLAKAVKYKTTYVCKEIKGGTVLEVSEDVINKVEAPYSDLKKFIENK